MSAPEVVAVSVSTGLGGMFHVWRITFQIVGLYVVLKYIVEGLKRWIK